MDAAVIIIFAIVAMIVIFIIGGIGAGISKRKENKKQAELVEVLLKKETK